MDKDKPHKIKTIKENAILNIIYTLANILFPLLTYSYVLRILPVDRMGRISFYTSVTNYAIMVAALGLTTYGIRTVAKERDNKDSLEKVVSELFSINLMTTFLVIIVYLLLIFFVPKFSRDIVLGLLNGLIIISAPMGMNWFFSGLEQYGYITKRTLLFKTFSLILIFLFVNDSEDYYIYASILVLTTLGTVFCNYVYSKRLTSFHVTKSVNIGLHIKPMLVLFASALAVSVYFNLDTIMLGFIKGDWDVGIYTTAVRVKTVLLELINAISVVLLPRLSFYLSQGKNKQYKIIVQKAMAVILIISISMTLFFIIESLPCVLILGGAEYSESSIAMKVLMPILIISGFSNVLGNQILIPNGRESYFLRAVVTGAVVDIILNVFLMPKYGSVGAAIATLIAEFSQMSVQAFYSKDVLYKNINWRSIIKACIASATSGCAILLFKINTNFGNLVHMMFAAILFFGLYMLILLLLKEEYTKEIIYDVFSKIKKRKDN